MIVPISPTAHEFVLSTTNEFKRRKSSEIFSFSSLVSVNARQFVAYAWKLCPLVQFAIEIGLYCKTTLTVCSFCVGTMGRSAPVVVFFAWRLTCFDRWSLRMNGFVQIWQMNFFSPVCVRLWRDSSSERENRRSQFSHLQMNGRSPVWMRWCAFKWLDLK